MIFEQKYVYGVKFMGSNLWGQIYGVKFMESNLWGQIYGVKFWTEILYLLKNGVSLFN